MSLHWTAITSTTITIVQEGSTVPRQDHQRWWKWIAAVLVVTSAHSLHACDSDGETARTERTPPPPAATAAPTTVASEATTTPATTRPATPAASPSPPAASRSAAITAEWGEANQLTIDGSDFNPNERVAVTLSVQSQQSSGGSSQSSSQQSTVTVSADTQGNLHLETTVAAPAGASVSVTTAGDRGSSAAVRTAVPSR
jgi:hypothetical protein